MLSADDRRRLDAIEAQLRADDPRFADAMTGVSPGSPPDRRPWWIALIALGVMFVVSGFVGGVGSMTVLGLCLVGGAWWIMRHERRRRPIQ